MPETPQTLFRHYPSRPRSQECQNAYLILRYAHDAATSFLDSFDKVRTARKARGTPTDEEQDLLRAMLVFATAGLDSMVKQLIVDALPTVINQSPGATEMLRQFVERRLGRGDETAHKLMARVLINENPRQVVTTLLVADLTGESLQSVNQISRTASFFDIPTKELTNIPDSLRPIFDARNQIVHEMDIDMSQPNRNRRPRAKTKMVDYTNRIFGVCTAFLNQVDNRCTTN